MNGRNQEEINAVVNEINEMGGKAIGFKGDVRVRDEVEAMVQKCVDEFGKIDIMVANAGLGITKRVVEMTEEEWDQVIDTNLKGAFFSVTLKQERK